MTEQFEHKTDLILFAFRYAKNRISGIVRSLVNNVVAELYYLTGYLPSKLKAKQAVFKAKQAQAMNQLLKQNKEKPRSSKSSTKTSNKTMNEVDRGGFDERWERNRNHQMSFSNPASSRTDHNRSADRNRSAAQPVPPVRKSKLLSAAIVSNQLLNRNAGPTAVKLMPNHSPVIATISSPNSNQTLQVRSHLIVHPAGDHPPNHHSNHQPNQQTPLFTGHPSKLPISPIPYRPVQSNPFYNQQLRQFQSAPQLPMRYGPSAINQPNTSTMNSHNQTFPAFESGPFVRDGQVFARKSLPPSYFNRHQPQYLSTHSSRSQAPDQPHTSTFIKPHSFADQSPFDQSYLTTNSFVPQQFVNNLNYDDPVQSIRQRSLSAPDQVNSRLHYLSEDQVPYFSPIPDSRAAASFPASNQFAGRLDRALSPHTAFGHPSSTANFSYHPSFASANIFPRRHPLINAADSPNYPAAYPPTAFYAKSPEFGASKTWLPSSPIGSDLHRIETINRMRLAQLAKERRRAQPSRSYPSSYGYPGDSPFREGAASIMSDPFDKLNKSDFIDYLNYRDERRRLDSRLLEERLLEKRLLKHQSKRKLLYAVRLDQDDFEADAEDEIGNGYVFHKSLARRRLDESTEGSKRVDEDERAKIVAIAGTAKSSLRDDYGISGNKNKSIAGEEEVDDAVDEAVDEVALGEVALSDVGAAKKEQSGPDQLGQNDNKVNSSNGLSEEVSSSGRGSSNLDNSPKFSKPSAVAKSNSSSSGFASRTFSITGSPDKCATPQAYHSDQFDKLSDKSQASQLKKRLNEASEADENYEFDQLNSPQSNELDSGRLLSGLLYKRNCNQPNLQRLRNLQLAAASSSLSACTTPTTRLYAESEKDELLRMMQKQRRIQQLKRQQRMEQASLMSDEPFDDFDLDGDRCRIDAADEEIRQHLDHLVGPKRREFNSLRETAMHPSLHANYSNLSYPLNSPPPHNLTGNLHLTNLPTLDPSFSQQQRLNLLEQQSARSFGSAPPIRHGIRLDRAVFSDSELYDNQLNGDDRTNLGANATSAYQMSRYLRRMRCEQLKEEFRRKYGERFKATNLETAC